MVDLYYNDLYGFDESANHLRDRATWCTFDAEAVGEGVMKSVPSFEYLNEYLLKYYIFMEDVDSFEKYLTNEVPLSKINYYNNQIVNFLQEIPPHLSTSFLLRFAS
jgi:hypothetical protein